MYHHVYSSHVSRDFAPDEDSQINTNIVLAEEPLHPQLLLQLWAKIVLEHLMVSYSTPNTVARETISHLEIFRKLTNFLVVFFIQNRLHSAQVL